jgi:hypothetical protein
VHFLSLPSSAQRYPVLKIEVVSKRIEPIGNFSPRAGILKLKSVLFIELGSSN